MDLAYLILLYAVSADMLFILIWIFYSEKRLNNFFVGGPAKSLEDIIKALVKNSGVIDSDIEKIRDYLDSINSRLKKSTKRAHLIRYNAFGNSGGNQSFAICLLDEDGNGAIISSLFARDKNTVYGKPIERYSSKHELSSEEKEVIEKAKRSNNDN